MKRGQRSAVIFSARLRWFPIQAVLFSLLRCISTAHAQQSTDEEKLGVVLTGGPVVDFVTVQRMKVYRASRATGPIIIDGNIDEPDWSNAEVGSDFYQTDPKNGYPATEKTEFRILYDNDNLYVSVICHQAGPIQISELKREFAPVDGDQIVLYFDTFNDKKSGFAFHTNPGSAMRDGQIDAVGTPNENWDGVFSVASRIQPPGWTTEFAIPFKTLRFDGMAKKRFSVGVLICSASAGTKTNGSSGRRPHAHSESSNRVWRERRLAPFFSRRIGLSSEGQPLPIRGGARLTGTVGGLSERHLLGYQFLFDY